MRVGYENVVAIKRFPFWGWVAALGAFFALAFAACQNPIPTRSPSSTPTSSLQPTASITWTPLPTMTLTATPTRTVTLPPTFEPPSLLPATAVPPPLATPLIPAEDRVTVLLGSDQEIPYVGRMQAIHLIIYNPRLAKASIVSIPPDLFVYIPGYTMQRINVAYAVGGLEALYQTLLYNFGVRPDHYVLAHPSDFQAVSNELGGLEVPVLSPFVESCGAQIGSKLVMTGEQAYCYASLLQGGDVVDRLLRQQQLLRVLFLRMVEGGNLARLPGLYQSYQATIQTDFALSDLVTSYPLALKLGDSQRVSYYIVGWDQVTTWEMPGAGSAIVLLPRQQAVQELIQAAVDAANLAAPQTGRVATLQFELTASPTPSGTPTVTPTVTATPTFTITVTRTLGPTETLTRTSTPAP
jgi:anionic cell wall polymer biosynthesis LytR-Cps2A-Psr (LCP) family protein